LRDSGTTRDQWDLRIRHKWRRRRRNNTLP
jgi:hypothetical protein